jgi:cytochrome P450
MGRHGEVLAAWTPPRHNKVRALVSQAFTPRAVNQQANNIRTIANRLLDTCASSDTLELIHDFASPFPMSVIAGMLGVPLTQQDDFKRWTQGILGHSQGDAAACFLAFSNYMRNFFEEKRRDKQDDLVSALLDAQVDGESLSEQELVYFCMLLLGAGLKTTEHLIGNIVLCLDEYPGARKQVWADPSLLPSTIDEVLRFRPVIHRTGRVAKQDTEIGGKQIKAGHFLFAWTASANRDEKRWTDPDFFDIRRSPNTHLAFSAGIHTCLGASLARLEAKIALEQLIERFKDIQVIHETPIQLISSYTVYGVQQLPLRVYRR